MSDYSRPPDRLNERPWDPDNMPEAFLAGQAAEKRSPTTLVLGQPSTVIGVQKTLAFPAAFPTPSGSAASAMAGFSLLPNSVLYGSNPAPQIIAQQEQGTVQAAAADQTSRLYTISLTSRGYPQTPRTSFGTGYGNILRAHLIWGAGQAVSDVWFDCTNGAVISIGASTIQLSVACLAPPNIAPGTLPSTVGVFIAEGQRTLTKPLRVTEVYQIAANATNWGPFNITVPPYATDVLINRRDNTGTFTPSAASYIWALSDWFGNVTLTATVAAGVDMQTPVTIPGNCAGLSLSSGVSSTFSQLFTVSWGLTI